MMEAPRLRRAGETRAAKDEAPMALETMETEKRCMGDTLTEDITRAGNRLRF